MLDESELVDSLANKAPRTHKAMLISQGFNPETANLETFVEHCERAETTDEITGAKFAASEKDSDPLYLVADPMCLTFSWARHDWVVRT